MPLLELAILRLAARSRLLYSCLLLSSPGAASRSNGAAAGVWDRAAGRAADAAWSGARGAAGEHRGDLPRHLTTCYYLLLTTCYLLRTTHCLLGEHSGDLPRHLTAVARRRCGALLDLCVRLRLQAVACAAAFARAAAAAALEPRQARYLVITPAHIAAAATLLYSTPLYSTLLYPTLLHSTYYGQAFVARQRCARVHAAYPLREQPPLQAGGRGPEEEEGLGAQPSRGGRRDGSRAP